eukprot:TRINITY_DN45122_c0_g1_i1.p1 TRINITY_DN45122_c0_g1~~TRINITY_DN45122_c0_g1_i1.p1  ORF type:complete len:159 (-),score=24.72 TRINITY_DN45122_c0_g1_i1:153-629(-)
MSEGANTLVSVFNRSDSFKARVACMRDEQNLQGHTGRHCQVEGCGTFDYLPSQCHICSQYLCDEHAKPAAHGCVRYTRELPACPICNEFILLFGLSEDQAMSEHIESGCTRHLKTAVEQARRKTNQCNFRGKRRCQDKSLIKIECDGCKKLFLSLIHI